MEQNDQIVSRMIKCINHQIIKRIQQILILELACTKCHQDLLSSTDFFLLNREMQFKQIVAD